MTWTHIKERRPIARKQHVCELCGREIFPGRRYVVRFGYGDGRPVRFMMHEHCEYQTRGWDLMDWEVCDTYSEFQMYELGERL